VRILYLSHETGFSFGVYLEVISRALVARGHEVHILNCSPFNPSQPHDDREAGVWIHRRRHLRARGSTRLLSNPMVRPVVDRLRAPEVPAWTSPLTRLNAAATNYVEYRRLGFDADVVEAPEHLAEGLAFGVLRTRPLVVELHGPLGAVVPYWGFRPGWHLRVSDRIERLGARCATMTVAPSRFLADELAHAGWAGARHARVVPHAIDVATWRAVEPAGDTAPVVLAVGDVSEAKGADVLVDAAALLGATVGDVELVFVGSSVTLPDGGSSVEAIAERAGRAGVRCRFTGHIAREELLAWYARARVVAVASRFDSFSQAGLEAMAAGRPVVCSTRAGLAEIAEPGDDGLTRFTSGDARELRARLEPFLRDPALAARAGARARALVEARCAPAVVAAAREALYEEARASWRTPRGARGDPQR
jgi:glycosyltransferase involved in cell wall biosynthesis